MSQLRSLVSDARRRGRPETASALEELLAARARLRAADELARCAQVIVDDDLEMGPALWPEHRALVDALDAYRNSGGEG